MRISDWSSDVCSSDLRWPLGCRPHSLNRILKNSRTSSRAATVGWPASSIRWMVSESKSPLPSGEGDYACPRPFPPLKHPYKPTPPPPNHPHHPPRVPSGQHPPPTNQPPTRSLQPGRRIREEESSTVRTPWE